VIHQLVTKEKGKKGKKGGKKRRIKKEIEINCEQFEGFTKQI